MATKAHASSEHTSHSPRRRGPFYSVAYSLDFFFSLFSCPNMLEYFFRFPTKYWSSLGRILLSLFIYASSQRKLFHPVVNIKVGFRFVGSWRVQFSALLVLGGGLRSCRGRIMLILTKGIVIMVAVLNFAGIKPFFCFLKAVILLGSGGS